MVKNQYFTTLEYATKWIQLIRDKSSTMTFIAIVKEESGYTIFYDESK